jgi:hypothetical protein
MVNTKTAKRLPVGGFVRFEQPWKPPRQRPFGEVIEDRGPLGKNGQQVVRVLYAEDFSGTGELKPVETEISAGDVQPVRIRLYEFEAVGGDTLELSVENLREDDYVLALVLPEKERHRIEPWTPGKPVGFFSTDEAMLVTREEPTARYRIPSAGRWLVELVVDDRAKAHIVRQDPSGSLHMPDKESSY